MSKHDLQNEELDEIARNLFRRSKLSAAELEKIIAAPHLFASIKARISAEEQSRRRRRLFSSGLFDWCTVVKGQRAAVVCALAVIVGAAAFLTSRQKTPTDLTELSIAPLETSENPAQSGEIANSEVGKSSETESAPDKKRAAVQTKITKAARSKSAVGQKKTRRPKAAAREQPPAVFYSLASAGNWEASGEDLRVVRAELSTTELFALGVNVPVENEISKIKTDLLVGANGVPKAIRFVE